MSDHFESLLTGLNSEDREEIATIPERFVQRALNGDWDGVAELYHPAAIQMPPDQPAVKGRTEIRQSLVRNFGAESGAKLQEFDVRIREAEGIGDLIFVRAAYHIRMSVQLGNQEFSIDQQGPYINILRRDEEGHWRIYRQIYGRDHPAPLPGV